MLDIEQIYFCADVTSFTKSTAVLNTGYSFANSFFVLKKWGSRKQVTSLEMDKHVTLYMYNVAYRKIGNQECYLPRGIFEVYLVGQR